MSKVPGSHECHARVGRQRCGIGSHHGWAWRLRAVSSLKRPKRASDKKKADGNSWNEKPNENHATIHETSWNYNMKPCWCNPSFQAKTFSHKLHRTRKTKKKRKKKLPDGSTPPVFSSSSVQRHQASTAMAKALARGFNVKKMDVRCWWKKIQRDLWGIYLKYTYCTKEHIYIYMYI